jgi:hypothetical protein
MKNQFCYLNRKKNEYDFYIVEFSKVNFKEYLTVSPKGITHVKDGETNFITIEQWELEAKQYHKIKKI